jgi:radical SAM-linked protein
VRASDGYPIRVRFTKHGKVRFISHRDVARAFERAFRIEALPLAFTQGFSPRPKVSFGLALSVGHESEAEYLDLELREQIPPESLVPPMSDALPVGMDVTGAVALADRAPSLQEAVTAVEYRVGVADPDGNPPSTEALQGAIDRALSATRLEVARTRKGREIVEDLRPIIRELQVVAPSTVTDDPATHHRYRGDDDAVVLGLELSTQPRGARPGDVISALDLPIVEVRVTRTCQWIERDGARLEPLEADARPRVPEARAS